MRAMEVYRGRMKPRETVCDHASKIVIIFSSQSLNQPLKHVVSPNCCLSLVTTEQ